MEPERFAPFLGDEATFKKREADMAKRLVFSYNYKFYCFVWFVLQNLQTSPRRVFSIYTNCADSTKDKMHKKK